MSDGAVIVLIPLFFVTLFFATFIGLILLEILKTLRKIHSGLEKNASLLVETNKRIAGSAARMLDSANSEGTNVLAARVQPTTAPETDKNSERVQGIQALLDRLAEGIAQTRTATHRAQGPGGTAAAGDAASTGAGRHSRGHRALYYRGDGDYKRNEAGR